MLHLREVRLLSDQYPARDRYPFNIDVLKQTQGIKFTSPITFFAGENGSGKSTLLEALARRCNIHIWSGIERTRSVVNPYEETFFLYIEVEWTDGIVPGSFFSSQIFRNFAQLLDEWEADSLACPGSVIYSFDHSPVKAIHYEDTEHYQIYKSFMENPGGYLTED